MTYRYCKKCKQIKPPRAHHCSVCGRCVLKMDHHCPWVGNCVGYNNHKIFFQFLIYTTTGCLYSALTMGLYAMQMDRRAPRGAKENITMASVLSVALVFAISLLLVSHAYFTWTSQSSIESGSLMSFNPFFERRNPKSLAGLLEEKEKVSSVCRFLTVSRKNFFQVAGTHPLYWFLPLYTPDRHRVCDGINWKMQVFKDHNRL